jgi:hypothetical protein
MYVLGTGQDGRPSARTNVLSYGTDSAYVLRNWRPPAPVNLICRNEDVTNAHIHARTGILIQTISTLPTITAQPFLSL